MCRPVKTFNCGCHEGRGVALGERYPVLCFDDIAGDIIGNVAGNVGGDIIGNVGDNVGGDIIGNVGNVGKTW